MLNAKIHVDLPSEETLRNKGPLEWVRSMFGAELDLRSGKEELTVSALSLIQGFVTAMNQAEITDVISMIVDKKVIYLDSDEVPDDLAVMMDLAESKGVLNRPFEELHIALSHKEAGLHTIIDVKVANQVVLGEEEMEITLSGRIEELQVQTGEDAEAYAARVRSFATDEQRLTPLKSSLDALSERIADKIRTRLVGSKPRTESAAVKVVQPGKGQVGNFRNLGFGKDVEKAHYRPVPTQRRSGAYDDPFYYYYYDPYHSLTSWILIDSMMHHQAWHSHDYVGVVAPSGDQLYTPADALTHQHDADWVDSNAVDFSNNICVAASVPEVSYSSSDFGVCDDASASSADFTDSGDSGSSDSSSSCGSSCGSSCSSSCGGGCGGGCS